MNLETVRAWIQKAESDLKVAKDQMKEPNPATDAICFHSQQCAEKYLKAFLFFMANQYPEPTTLLGSLCNVRSWMRNLAFCSKVMYQRSLLMQWKCVIPILVRNLFLLWQRPEKPLNWPRKYAPLSVPGFQPL